MRTGLLALRVLLVSVSPGALADQFTSLNAQQFFATTRMREIRIDVDDIAQTALRLDPRVYVKSRVTECDELFFDVGVHLKGNYGTFQAMNGKPSLTLNFDKFLPRQKFQGIDKLHLNNSASDPTFMSELIGRAVFTAAGLPSAGVTHSLVNINGRETGLYVLVEGYDRQFLRHHFQNPNGNLYDSEFMHDVTEPLKKSSGMNAHERPDLEALAAAAHDPDPAARLAHLGNILDLDHFYSFLALEIMLCHSDGYAMAKNNYWVYHVPQLPSSNKILTSRDRQREIHRDPKTQETSLEIPQHLLTANSTRAVGIAVSPGRMVFLPHGMDQMFWQPRRSLFPRFRGIIADALLHTTEGRQRYRERCVTLYTNLFPGLVRRVEELDRQLRPAVAYMGTNALANYDPAVVALKMRIAERVDFLRTALTVPPLTQTILNLGEETVVTHWSFSVEQGAAEVPSSGRASDRGIRHVSTNMGDGVVRRPAGSVPGQINRGKGKESVEEGLPIQPKVGDLLEPLPATAERMEGCPALSLGWDGKPAVAMWEKRLILQRGIYALSVAVQCDEPIFRGPNSLVALKLWGGSDLESETIRTDAQHVALLHSFEVTLGTAEEVLIQCEIRSGDQPLTFQLERVRLMRLQ